MPDVTQEPIVKDLSVPPVSAKAMFIVAADETTPLKPGDVPNLQPPVQLTGKDYARVTSDDFGPYFFEDFITNLSRQSKNGSFSDQPDEWKAQFRRLLAFVHATIELKYRIQMPHHAVHHRLEKYISVRANEFKHADAEPRVEDRDKYFKAVNFFSVWWNQTIAWVTSAERLTTRLLKIHSPRTSQFALEDRQPDSSARALPCSEELQARITALEAANAELKADLAELKAAHSEIERDFGTEKQRMSEDLETYRDYISRLADAILKLADGDIAEDIAIDLDPVVRFTMI